MENISEHLDATAVIRKALKDGNGTTSREVIDACLKSAGISSYFTRERAILRLIGEGYLRSEGKGLASVYLAVPGEEGRQQ